MSLAVVVPLPDRQTAHWLLASVLLVLAPHAAYQPLWLSGLILLLLAWRTLLTLRGWPVPGRLLRYALILFVTVLVYRHYHTVFGRDPGVGLLGGMLALKLLELRSQRDYLLAAFLLYFLILASFLYSQSLWLAAYLLGAILLCTATLVRLAQPGAEGRYALGLAGRLLLQALPLMLLMYLLFPRIQGSLWGMPLDAHSGVTGMSEEMRPGSINQLNQSDAVAFRAAFSGPPPANAALYWRSLIMWQTDGRAWSVGDGQLPVSRSFEGLGASVDYEVTFEASNRRWLVALDLPASQPPSLRLQPGFILSAVRPVRERLRYALTSRPRYRTGVLTPAERAAALQLPADIGVRTRALAAQWRAQSSREDEVVRAALNFFRSENFAYTLQPPLLGRQPVEEFLFDVRRGYCEHYATALVALMRAAGIPARVLAGYQGGEFNPTGNYLIVRQSDAHAWAEVWLTGQGWVRVDPTAAVAPERIEYGAGAVRRLARQGAAFGQPAESVRRALSLGWLEGLAQRGVHLWDAVDMAWNTWVLDYSVERQQQLLRRLGFQAPSALQMVQLLAGVSSLLLLAYAFYGWRAPTRDPVLRTYEKFCRKLARIGLVRAPHEGAQDFASRCAQQQPDLAEDIIRLTQQYVGLRYGAPPGRKARQQFEAAVATWRVPGKAPAG